MSATPLAQRLQVKGERRLFVSDAPAAIDAVIDVPRAAPEVADVVLRFIRVSCEQPAAFAFLKNARPDAILWLAYPKRSSLLASDLGRDTIREAAEANGLCTIAQIAIDTDYSALRLKRL